MSFNPVTAFADYKIRKVFEQILDDLDSVFIFSINNTKYPLIKNYIKKDIKKHKSDWRLTYYDNPDHIVPIIYAVLDVSRRFVSTGRYNFHFGMLSSEGEELVQVFNKCLEILLEKKLTNKQDVREAKKTVR